MSIRMELQPDGYTKKWLVYDSSGYLVVVTVCENTARAMHGAIKTRDASSTGPTHADDVER